MTYPEALTVLKPHFAQRICENSTATENLENPEAHKEFCGALEQYQSNYRNASSENILSKIEEKYEKRREILSKVARWYTVLRPEWDYPQIHVTLSNLIFVQHMEHQK
ncbi:unnamed protein product [Gongylonema pulchrum]|uniref:MADF domain-containing protein n=1 Tax=Gongylonema pulchrum TaxID=637853 RepID=A0A183D8T4_9BILA|nr:unnamed protein product [Gongylonema pulchrum]